MKTTIAKTLALATVMTCSTSFAAPVSQGPIYINNVSDSTVFLLTAESNNSQGPVACQTTIPTNNQLIGSLVPGHTVTLPFSYYTHGQVYSVWAAFTNYDNTTLFCQCTPRLRDPAPNGVIEVHNGGCISNN